MGEAVCFAAVREENVLGTIGAALRHLLLSDGRERTALYLGDFKIAPHARGGRTLVRLVHAVRHWVGQRTDAAFGVVMDGTRVTPLAYTGRLDIPLFRELGKVIVLRLPTKPGGGDDDLVTPSGDLGSSHYLRLSAGRYASPGGIPSERSETVPLWLMTADGRACGRLEDTRRAKRLIADDGSEMCSAHLSCFAYHDLDAAVELLKGVCCRAARLSFPAVFVAVTPRDADDACRGLGSEGIVSAPATIYGTGLEPGLWNINTAEI
jgi:hypothetical protein